MHYRSKEQENPVMHYRSKGAQARHALLLPTVLAVLQMNSSTTFVTPPKRVFPATKRARKTSVLRTEFLLLVGGLRRACPRRQTRLLEDDEQRGNKMGAGMRPLCGRLLLSLRRLKEKVSCAEMACLTTISSDSMSRWYLVITPTKEASNLWPWTAPQVTW